MNYWQCVMCAKTWPSEEPPVECACGSRLVLSAPEPPPEPPPAPVPQPTIPPRRLSRPRVIAAVAALLGLVALGACLWHQRRVDPVPEALPPSPTLSPDFVKFNAEDGLMKVVNATSVSANDLTCEPSQDFIKARADFIGEKDGVFVWEIAVTVLANETPDTREGVVTVSAGGYPAKLVVFQEGKQLSEPPAPPPEDKSAENKTAPPVAPQEEEPVALQPEGEGEVDASPPPLTLSPPPPFGWKGGTTNIVVTSVSTNNILCKSLNENFITANVVKSSIKGEDGKFEWQVTVTAKMNVSTSVRDGFVQISAGNETNTFAVIQDPRPPLNLAPDSLTFGEKDDKKTVLIKNVPTNAVPKVESANASFSGSTPARVKGKDDEWEMTVTARPNTGSEERGGKMTISVGDETKTLTFTQKGRPKP